MKKETDEKNKIPEKFLPIGTVVTLKEGTKSIMIIGYCPVTSNKLTYDYSAVLVPEGSLKSDEIIVFNHEMIEKVNYIGMQNKEQEEYNERIKKYIEETNKSSEKKENNEEKNS